jgi:elongator complex protein 3
LQAQRWNETAPHRNVGLVIETRPDTITPDQVVALRRLGVTKVQLGVQSLDDAILARNRRGHTVEQTRRAIGLLRLGGFKIALHWMPNLLGATPSSDRADFERLWSDPALRPDELKIYPCVLLPDTALYDAWQRGAWHPYDEESLIDLVADLKTRIPLYCRVNRVNRDIPATYIVAGSKRANLRQLARERLARRGGRCRCIRCREVRGAHIEPEKLFPQTLIYPTDVSLEYWLSEVTADGLLAGFLRLSLPKSRDKVRLERDDRLQNVVAEIADCAMIREVHVYGPALAVGIDSDGEAQHLGVGRRLIARAGHIARQSGFRRLAVIAATGTRNYYRGQGFVLGELYMSKNL